MPWTWPQPRHFRGEALRQSEVQPKMSVLGSAKASSVFQPQVLQVVTRLKDTLDPNGDSHKFGTAALP